MFFNDVILIFVISIIGFIADSPLWQHEFLILDLDVDWSDEEIYTAIPLNTLMVPENENLNGIKIKSFLYI